MLVKYNLNIPTKTISKVWEVVFHLRLAIDIVNLMFFENFNILAFNGANKYFD